MVRNNHIMISFLANVFVLCSNLPSARLRVKSLTVWASPYLEVACWHQDRMDFSIVLKVAVEGKEVSTL